MLKEIEFKKSVAELAFIAQGGDQDVVARLTAVEQLADGDDKELARKTLAVVLASKDQREVRASAADGLAKLGAPGAGNGAANGSANGAVVAALTNGVKDPEPRVRRACVAGLGRVAADLGDAKESTTQVVAEALRTDLSYNVQQAACETLGKLGGDAALITLRAATDFPSPNERVAGAALRARLAMADGMAVDEVFKLAGRSADPRRRALGLASLGGLNEAQMGGRRDEAIALLLDAAQNGNGDLIRAAVQSLGELKAVEAEEPLKKLAERQDGPRFLPFVARNALRQIDEAKKKAADVAAAPPPKPAPTAEELARTVADLQKQIEAMKAQLETLKKPAPTAPVPTGGGR
jgi:HEAT repeat protein